MKKNVTSKRINLAITQVSSLREIDYFRCSVIEHHNLFRCGSTIDTAYSKGFYSVVNDITREECEKMLNKGTFIPKTDSGIELNFDTPGFSIVSYTSWGSISSDGSCKAGHPFVLHGQTFDKPVRNTRAEIKVMKGKAQVDYETREVIFGNGARCRYEKEYCEQSEMGHIFWDKEIPECPHDEKRNSLVYFGSGVLIEENGKTKDKFIQVSHSDYDFQIMLLNQKTTICDKSSYLTEHPGLFATVLEPYDTFFPMKKPIEPTELRLIDYINSKIIYSHRQTRNDVLQLFNIFLEDRCKTQNRITQNMMTLAILSPREFAYQYFQEPGHTAVVRGEVVHVAKCNPVLVTPIPRNGQCYNELPVSYLNETWFMCPRTRILVNKGSVVDCIPGMEPKYKIYDKWVIQTEAGLIETKIPNTISHEEINFEFEDVKSLSSGGLYTNNMINKMQKMMVSPMEEGILQTRIIKSLEGGVKLPEGYSMVNSFTINDFNKIEEKVENWFSRMMKKITTFGSLSSSIIGLIIIIKTALYVFSSIVNFSILYKTYGLTLKLFAFWWDSLTHHILNGRTDFISIKYREYKEKRENKKKKDNKDSKNDDLESGTAKLYPDLN